MRLTLVDDGFRREVDLLVERDRAGARQTLWPRLLTSADVAPGASTLKFFSTQESIHVVLGVGGLDHDREVEVA